MTPGISVIIPSFNGADLLSENLPHVLKSLDYIDQFEIIVIDDASADHTQAYIQEHFPQIRIFRNNKNLGFARSVNKGIYKAKYELVFLLNNDIKPDENFISSSLKYFNEIDTFGVMGIILDQASKEVLEGIKYPVRSMSGLKYKDIRNNNIVHLHEKIYTFYLCGGNAIINRKKLIEMNGFMDIYEPFYQEDVDLSVRAWLSGWKLYLNNKAICYHQHSATIKKYFDSGYIKNISKRNRLILSYIYLNGCYWHLFNLITIAKSLYYGFLYMLKFQSVYPGYREFFKLKKKLKKYRLTEFKIKDISQLIPGIQKNIKETLKKPGEMIS